MKKVSTGLATESVTLLISVCIGLHSEPMRVSYLEHITDLLFPIIPKLGHQFYHCKVIFSSNNKCFSGNFTQK